MKKNKVRTGGRILFIPTAEINENPLRPRIYYNADDLAALCDSISQIGIVEPLTVFFAENDRYYVVSGERRLRAARFLGLDELPCIVVDFNEKQASFACLAQNTQRRELNFFETAVFLERLHDAFGYTYRQLSEKTGIPVQEIHQKIRLLAIPAAMRKTVIENGLTERFAQLLLRHPDDEQKQTLLEMIIGERLPLSEAKARSSALLREAETKKRVYLRFFKDITVFVNTVERAVDAMLESGVPAESDKTDAEDYVEYRVRIPK